MFTYFKLHSKSCDYLYLFLVSLITFLFFLFNPIPSFNHSSTGSFIRSSHLFCICPSIHLPAYPPTHPSSSQLNRSCSRACVHSVWFNYSCIQLFKHPCTCLLIQSYDYYFPPRSGCCFVLFGVYGHAYHVFRMYRFLGKQSSPLFHSWPLL